MHPITTPPAPIIRVTDLSFSYRKGAPVLSGVNLTVSAGDYLGLIGPNGGGKSTLLKLILGLLEPTAGAVELFGMERKKFRQWNRIGYISQKATDFDPAFPVTVEEVVLMGRYAKRGLFHFPDAADTTAAYDALKKVDMLDAKNTRIGNLSGGQQQRVFIARALASEPDVLLLDEPTSNIDAETQDEFYQLLKRLNVDLGLTLILVSHDLDCVSREATSVAVVKRTLTYYDDPKSTQNALATHHEQGHGGTHHAHVHV